METRQHNLIKNRVQHFLGLVSLLRNISYNQLRRIKLVVRISFTLKMKQDFLEIRKFLFATKGHARLMLVIFQLDMYKGNVNIK